MIAALIVAGILILPGAVAIPGSQPPGKGTQPPAKGPVAASVKPVAPLTGPRIEVGSRAAVGPPGPAAVVIPPRQTMLTTYVIDTRPIIVVHGDPEKAVSPAAFGFRPGDRGHSREYNAGCESSTFRVPPETQRGVIARYECVR